MVRLLNNKRALIAIATIVMFVAIVVPTCRMVGCSMTMGEAMPFGHQMVPGIFGSCGGTYVMNGAPAAVVPANADAFSLAFVVAVLAAVAFLFPRMVVQPTAIVEAAPPPPPEDPRGQRLRL